jgi:alpha-1,2-mannosyltransferase
MKLSSLNSPMPIRRRLWRAGSLLAIFVMTFLVGNCFLPQDQKVTGKMLGHDFLVFYTAGTMARTGHFNELYDLATINARESAIGQAAGLNIGKSYGPWWNPPPIAWFFAPFSALPLLTALKVWMALSAAALLASIILLVRMLPPPRTWRNWALVPMLMFAASPFWGVVTHGQNTFLSLLLLCGAVTFWRKRKGLAAGVMIGLMIYKPQIALVAGLVLVADLGLPAIIGLGAVGLFLLVITITTMPGVLEDYVNKLPKILAVTQEGHEYFWGRHLTLKAFWRLLLQGTARGKMLWPATLLWWFSESVVALLLARAVWVGRKDRGRTDIMIASAIVATPLLVPFYFDYDAALLSVGAVLSASYCLREESDSRLMWGWIVVYVTLMFSTPITSLINFNPAVPAIVLLMGILVAKTIASKRSAEESEPEPRLRALAA